MSGERAGPLWQLSASELTAAYGRGTTTPQDVLAATLERVEQVNPRLNALITLNRDGARAAATASTERWRAGQAHGPLDGVPITIKDSLFVADLRATWGSRLYADHVPQTDEMPVARLREAGAMILGKTNVPEFTVQGYTDNPLFGPTRNPWNTDLTPGGSSGGAVAAVAAGLGVLAIGTDGGGSIRRPASHTGLVGFKPSRGAVPRDRGFPAILLDFEVAGPIARCVDDIIAVMSVIGAPSAMGSSSDETVARCRVLFAPTFGDAPVDPEIAASVAAAAAGLDRQGHRVTQRHISILPIRSATSGRSSARPVSPGCCPTTPTGKETSAAPSPPWPKRERSSRRFSISARSTRSLGCAGGSRSTSSLTTSCSRQPPPRCLGRRPRPTLRRSPDSRLAPARTRCSLLSQTRWGCLPSACLARRPRAGFPLDSSWSPGRARTRFSFPSPETTKGRQACAIGGRSSRLPGC